MEMVTIINKTWAKSSKNSTFRIYINECRSCRRRVWRSMPHSWLRKSPSVKTLVWFRHCFRLSRTYWKISELHLTLLLKNRKKAGRVTPTTTTTTINSNKNMRKKKSWIAQSSKLIPLQKMRTPTTTVPNRTSRKNCRNAGRRKKKGTEISSNCHQSKRLASDLIFKCLVMQSTRNKVRTDKMTVNPSQSCSSSTRLASMWY